MTIRRKLGIAMLAMFCMLLVTTGVVQFIVGAVSSHGLSQAQMRELSVFTDDVRAEIFYQLAAARGFGPMRDVEDWWPDDVLQDIDVRVHHSRTDIERESWQAVRESVEKLASSEPDDPATVPFARTADQRLRGLRRQYDRHIADAMARTARVVSIGQAMVYATTLFSALLFAIVTLLIRDWFVKPINALNQATQEIGDGRLDHRLEVSGRDELAQLASHINTMTERLQEHQRQLVDNRLMVGIGEMCTNVAHGLRNPLAGMRASAQLAQRRTRDNEQIQEFLRDIISEIDCMDRRIAQLFEFSRTPQFNRTDTSAAQLIDDAQAEARGLLKSKSIQIALDDTTNGQEWPVDREKMAGVLGELLINAAHHSADNSTIDVRAALSANGASATGPLNLTIRDHGSGIAQNSLDKVFDLFYTTRPNGTGMGLSLVRRIVERHGGRIAIDSTPGDGTEVLVEIDRSSEREAGKQIGTIP